MEVIDKQITGVGFGYFSAEEIKALSVKQITVPYAFDNLNQPVPGGLYDKAMGPMDKFESCQTCTLPSKDCLGHLGHIQLCVPVYQPLLFDLLFKLMRAKCFVCHKFRMSRFKVKKLQAMLKLIDVGLLLKAKALETTSSIKDVLGDEEKKKKDQARKEKAKKDKKKKSKKGKKEEKEESEDDEEMEDVDEGETVEETEDDKMKELDALIALADQAYRAQQKSRNPYKLTRHDLEFRKHVVHSFFKDVPARKCANCGGFSPPLRRDGHTKIFKLPLTKQQEKQMLLNKLRIVDVLGDEAGKRQAQREEEEKYGRLLKEQEREKRKKKAEREKKKKLLEARKKKAAAGSDNDDDEDEVMDMEAQEDDEEEDLSEDDDNNKAEKKEEDTESVSRATLMFPNEVEKHMQLTWEQESTWVGTLWGSLSKLPAAQSQGQGQLSHTAASSSSADCSFFFVRVLAVPPPRFRPPAKHGDKSFDHPQNVFLKKILENDKAIMEKGAKQNGQSTVVEDYNAVTKFWLDMQSQVNALIDSSKAGMQDVPAGIRQLLEKKHGLFRMNMMGKRVNFAARSVISPDPFLHTKEIGVPELFARKLTYPEPVTPYNIKEMRQAVINGPDVHPGANAIEDERGNVIDLHHKTKQQRIALSKTLLTTGMYDAATTKSKQQRRVGAAIPPGVKRVLRHLRTGDVMLANRQPTLHKPSIMAHIARVLKSQQTIRMHYANCNTYNADFDGDELNLHFPQNELARAEAYNIANTNNQYCKPTDGAPLRGLIQDHVVAGVLLTKRDTFFTQDEFQQLVYSSCAEYGARADFHTPVPVILKPRPLWSGKQVLSTVLNIVSGVDIADKSGKARSPTINLRCPAKIPDSYWGRNSGEGDVIIRDNELCVGVLDKSAFGASSYGLVHAVYELLGPEIAGDLLSTLGRLFTLFLRLHGFTCGIGDMLLVQSAEDKRQDEIKRAETDGVDISKKFAEVEDLSNIQSALRQKLRNQDGVDALDSLMSSAMNTATSRIVDVCLPDGQWLPFPENSMSLMTVSGAKGSKVNFSQISCCLGQQALEGHRVPVLPSGKTLPSFRPYDPSPRAGGFITQRFLTGIKPQEYYFHCMAGREGLVDTAVKTARAGYLQRCLIKHLEGLRVGYDYSVRDNDGSVIQFHYGEDAIDIGKCQYLNKHTFLADNYVALLHRLGAVTAGAKIDRKAATAYVASQQTSKHPEKLDPVLTKYNPGSHLGSVSEAFYKKLKDYIKEDPEHMLNPAERFAPSSKLNANKFEALMQLKYMNSLVNPGETVGILCAQSIGEPATQMTLNTFHLAGHGGANVTLGLPRLREIIMTASEKIGTPIMELPLLPGVSSKQAASVASQLHRLKLIDFLADVSIKEGVDASGHNRLYTIRLTFEDLASALVSKHKLKFKHFAKAIENQFAMRMNKAVVTELKSLSKDNADAKAMGVKRKRDVGSSEGKKARPLPGSAAAAEQEDGEDQPTKRSRNPSDARTIKGKSKSRKNDSVDDYDEPDEDDEVALAEVEEAEQEEEEAVEAHLDGEDGDSNKNDKAEQEAAMSRSSVLAKCDYLSDIRYDAGEQWAEVVVSIPLTIRKLLMMSMVEAVSRTVLLRSTPNITACVVLKRKNKQNQEEEYLQASGINFGEVFKMSKYIDVNAINSNDIAAILHTYGVEAARAAIVNEISKVFGVYGISVDRRHLGLLADYMTHQGGYSPLNRLAMDINASPFQKISFETSMNFITNACLQGDVDFMQSPSARLVLGMPVKCGTGSFDLMQPLHAADEQ